MNYAKKNYLKFLKFLCLTLTTCIFKGKNYMLMTISNFFYKSIKKNKNVKIIVTCEYELSTYRTQKSDSALT